MAVAVRMSHSVISGVNYEYEFGPRSETTLHISILKEKRKQILLIKELIQQRN